MDHKLKSNSFNNEIKILINLYRALTTVTHGQIKTNHVIAFFFFESAKELGMRATCFSRRSCHIVKVIKLFRFSFLFENARPFPLRYRSLFFKRNESSYMMPVICF